jgi:molybdopterin molybdotransferase
MIAFEEALNIVLSSAKLLTTEEVALNQSLNRVLAQDLFSDMDMPPFNKSAVDGFACLRSDLSSTMTIVETIKAGKTPEIVVREGQCSRIMTGAMVPDGVDVVIMVEDTVETDDGRIQYIGKKTTDNICYKAEDIHKGDRVLEEGALIHPSHIAVMASVGYALPLVFRQPIVAILSTGDELVEPACTPKLSQIRNSNAAQLIAQVTAMNVLPLYLGIVPDDEEQTRSAIEQALLKADVVLITGGVSMGDFDFVPAILKEQKVKILFHSIAVQPGKPTLFGCRDDKYVFGLPGNPVSSFVQFEMLVKPLLYALSGHTYQPVEFKLPLGVDYKRRNNERRAFVPVRFIHNEGVIPVDYHGSAHIQAYVAAQGIMSVAPGVTQLKKGDLVDVRPL